MKANRVTQSRYYKEFGEAPDGGNIDPYDWHQNQGEWIRMVERAAKFAGGWTDDHAFKAALFRLRGEASEHIEQLVRKTKLIIA